jgi:hypothetical protein
MDSGNNSYKERNQCLNIAEIIFENYCKSKSYFIYRVGFDEKNNPVPNFFTINPFIRNLPDYFICNTSSKNQPCALVMVKGTANIKLNEYKQIPFYINSYSSPRCPLLYSFCFTGMNPLFLKPQSVMALYNKSFDRTWPDGKVYRNLNLQTK